MTPMNTPTSRLILTSEGFSPREEDRTHADEKAAKVLRHTTPRVDLVRLHLKRETPHSAPVRFTARATAEHAGPDHVIHAEADEPATAINTAFAKLERVLSSVAGLRKHERHVDPAPAV